MPMTPQEKKLKSARTRNLAAVKRSLRLITEEAESAAATLENNGVPGGGVFQPSVTKYENALVVLATLDGISSGGPDPEPDVPDIPAGLREDIGTLAGYLAADVDLQAVGEDTPLGRLARLAWPEEFAEGLQPYQPADPDGEPS